jgi:hypothetical protein
MLWFVTLIVKLSLDIPMPCQRSSRLEGVRKHWIPAFAGMTVAPWKLL